MKTKIVKEKELETVLSKKNYIILIIGSILIIAGYILTVSYTHLTLPTT